jgi:DNA-binding FadR family transcriptional regulator
MWVAENTKENHSPSLASVFDRLLADIVSGEYPPGSNLPAERDLSRALGASRATLREALRRLGEWRLIEARRGSGIVVRPAREWTLGALPAYLRHSALSGGREAFLALVTDLLAVRRSLVVDVVQIIAPRLGPGSLHGARLAARRAWDARDDVGHFVTLDFEVVRAVVDAAGFLPALWLLNGLAGVYAQIAQTLTGATMAPPQYLAAHDAVFDALEQGRASEACAAMSAYLDEHDRRLLAALRNGA